jgi:hypothetical protein
MSGFNSINNLGTNDRNKFSIGIGSRRSGSGSMARVFNYCNKGSTDLNVVFNCTFNTNYFTPNDTPIVASDYYLTGIFYYIDNEESLRIQGSNGQLYFDNTIYTESNNNTAYLVKYNTSGIPQWATKIGVFGDAYIGNQNSSNIIVDHKNTSLYICGTVYNDSAPTIVSLNFYNAGNYIIPGIQLQLSTYRNVYVAKYNTNGNVIWGTRIEADAYNTSITTDSELNMYVAFSYNGETVKIYETNNNTEVKTYSSTGLGNDAIMIVKYNSNGKYLWSTIITSPTGIAGTQVFCDKNDNIILTGFSYDDSGTDVTISIYNKDNIITPATTILVSYEGQIIAKFLKTGMVEWATKIDGKNISGRATVSMDLNNNIYLTTQCSSGSTPTIYSANGLGTPTLFATLPSAENRDTIVVKYNSSGAAQWYSRISGPDRDYQPYISVNTNGNIIVAGSTWSNTLKIYDSANNRTDIDIIQTLNNKNTFLVNFNTNGKLVWGTYMGPNFDESRVCVKCDNKNNIIVTGDYDEDEAYDLIFYKPNGANPAATLSLNMPTVSNYTNTFLVKYDINGVPIWCSKNYNRVDMPIITTPGNS